MARHKEKTASLVLWIVLYMLAILSPIAMILGLHQLLWLNCADETLPYMSLIVGFIGSVVSLMLAGWYAAMHVLEN